VIKLPKKKYTPKQDVQLGKEAASEVRKQYPIIEDQHIAKYLTQIGNRLVAAAPTELKQSVYEYSFTPVNLKDISAFALPGGPMFVQRGMFDAAAEEAEVASSIPLLRRAIPTARDRDPLRPVIRMFDELHDRSLRTRAIDQIVVGEQVRQLRV
jgi:hypothetical protein